MVLKKYLVAGGAGFIGSHLVERFVAEGHEVTVIDNLCTGSLNNISNVSEKISFICSDICQFDTCEKFDAVFHLACAANPDDYIKMPLELLFASSTGIHNLLEIANKSKARFYYFSSSEIYGHQMKSSDSVLSEDSYSSVGLLHKRSPYYIGKMFSEEFVKAYSTENNLNSIIIRPFNIYGTRMDTKSTYGRVISNFINWSIENKSLRINGDGKQTRSFCHINDLLDAVFLLEQCSNFDYPVLNIGNPTPISILGLAQTVQSISQKNLKIFFEEKVEHEPRWRTPDITKISQWLGWFPQITLKNGLKEVYEWSLNRV
jgi:Nucleoside-diphosphate-sugar epimerases